MLNIVILLQCFTILFSKSVNELKPSDIQCFGVLGDSVSAGFSLESHSAFKDLFEYRGKSFPIGGEKDFRTLPNIFSIFGSPKKCASYGSTFITHSIAQYPTSDKSSYSLMIQNPPPALKNEINCNVAISGALSNELMKMWQNLYVEWNKFSCIPEWKVLTIMIGANDICQYCLNGYNNTIQTYIFNLAQVFNDIIENAEMMFVNVISTFDVGLTADWQNEGCKIVHYLIDECPCILGREQAMGNREIVSKLYKDINRELYPLVQEYTQKGFPKNIRFVIQPIIEDFQIYNSSYLSSLDCFHPSEFGHYCMATLLWNNMFLPPNKKLKNLPYMMPLYQPGENDFLQ